MLCVTAAGRRWLLTHHTVQRPLALLMKKFAGPCALSVHATLRVRSAHGCNVTQQGQRCMHGPSKLHQLNAGPPRPCAASTKQLKALSSSQAANTQQLPSTVPLTRCCNPLGTHRSLACSNANTTDQIAAALWPSLLPNQPPQRPPQ